MTFLKQLLSRDIFGTSYRHNEIQHDLSSCWSAPFAAPDAAHNRVSVIAANAGAKSRCERMSFLVF
jgi:hypothetical protein